MMVNATVARHAASLITLPKDIRKFDDQLLPPGALVAATLLVTVGAIDSAIHARLKGHSGFSATVGTGRRVHLALTIHVCTLTMAPRAGSPLASVFGTTRRATTREISEPSTLVKGLLPCGEHEFLLTIPTHQPKIS
jgi:hypothetical protein